MNDICIIEYEKMSNIPKDFCASKNKRDCFSEFLHYGVNEYVDTTYFFVDKNNQEVIGYCTLRYIINAIVLDACPYNPSVEIMMFAIDIKYQDILVYVMDEYKLIATVCLEMLLSKLEILGYGKRKKAICLFSAFHAVDFYKRSGFIELSQYLTSENDKALFMVYDGI